jgi:hypothetical protein
MLKIKVTDINGTIEYTGDESLIARLSQMGHGKDAYPVLDEEGNTTGEIFPAEYTVEVTDITAQYNLEQAIKNRINEYPNLGDFMNAFFDGDQASNLEELKQKRLAIKAKYPKGGV